MSLLKAGLLVLSGAAIGAATVCELLRRRDNSKSYEVSLIKGVKEADDTNGYMVNGQLNTISTSPFRMHVIQDFVMRVEVLDDGIYFTPLHTDLEVVMLVKECMGLNKIDGVLTEMGLDTTVFDTVRTGEGWKASKLAVVAPVEVPVSEPVKEAKSDLRHAQPLKP